MSAADWDSAFVLAIAAAMLLGALYGARWLARTVAKMFAAPVRAEPAPVAPVEADTGGFTASVRRVLAEQPWPSLDETTVKLPPSRPWLGPPRQRVSSLAAAFTRGPVEPLPPIADDDGPPPLFGKIREGFRMFDPSFRTGTTTGFMPHGSAEDRRS